MTSAFVVLRAHPERAGVVSCAGIEPALPECRIRFPGRLEERDRSGPREHVSPSLRLLYPEQDPVHAVGIEPDLDQRVMLAFPPGKHRVRQSQHSESNRGDGATRTVCSPVLLAWRAAPDLHREPVG